MWGRSGSSSEIKDFARITSATLARLTRSVLISYSVRRTENGIGAAKMTEWACRGLIALCCVLMMESGAKGDGGLARAEQDFWRAAADRDHVVLISAYLLHFGDGRFAAEAVRLFQKKTGQTWTDKTAARAAWRERIGDEAPDLTDRTLAGDWTHSALCDVNAVIQDIAIDSEQVFRTAAPGVLTGTSTFRHGTRYSGRGTILRARRRGSLMTYVMRAENNVTGPEVHIGVLNLETVGGRLTTRGWEMNTAGTYCDLRGAKTR